MRTIYNAPILLHIDPPYGAPIDILEQALTEHPDTLFIFAHINAFKSPRSIADLMRKHSNLYIDFFAGFTLYDNESENTLEDFAAIAREFPNRFMLSTDSGSGIESEAAAAEAMYRFIDLLSDQELARKVAFENYDTILSNQLATQTQLEALLELGMDYRDIDITKLEAGRILIDSGK